MEENNKEIKKKDTTIAWVALAGVYVLGCIVGSANNNKKNLDAYKEGFYDAINIIKDATRN